MVRACAVLALLLPAVAAPQAISRQALERVPVKLVLDRSIWQQPAGSEVKLQVGVRNAFDQPVPVRADLRVELRSPALQKQIDVTIPAGQSTAQVVFAAPRTGGGGRIDATADGLQPASCVLLLREAAATASPELPKEVEPGAEPAPPPPPPPPPKSPQAAGGSGGATARPPAGHGAATPLHGRPAEEHDGLAQLGELPGATAAGSGLSGLHGPGAGAGAAVGIGGIGALAPRLTPRILVNPEQVRPDGKGRWSATLKLAVFDDGGRLVPADQAFPVQFTAQVGHLSDDVVVFKAGEFLSPPVALTSSSDGVDRVTAVTPLGTASPAQVSYERPVPARLRVDVPERVSNTGGGAQVQVSVLLVSEGGVATTYSDRDVPVTLRTTLGELAPPSLVIPRGAVGTAATLTSTRDGRAVLTVDAPGLASTQAQVRFSFPLLLALLAGAGGVTGQFLLRPRGSSKRGALWRSAVTGLVVGLLFYGVAAFHAFKEGLQIPLPVEVSRIATGNELGAFLLGCLGGLLGKAFWKVPSSDKSQKPGAPAAAGGPG